MYMFLNLFIHAFNKYLLSIYYTSGIVEIKEDISVNKTGRFLFLVDFKNITQGIIICMITNCDNLPMEYN